MKDKNILNSKKFAAFFFAVAVIAGILIVALIYHPALNPWTAAFLTIGMIAVGALAIGYIVSQKSLDKFLSTVKGVTDAVGKDSVE
jgi:hypothetical protein